MSEKNVTRSRIIGVRLTIDEYEKLEKKWRKTDCLKLSDYARKKLFDRPIVSTYRNKSLDEFMKEMIALRKSLESSSNVFFQSLIKAQKLSNDSEISTWLILQNFEKRNLLAKVDEIKESINKIADQWLQ